MGQKTEIVAAKKDPRGPGSRWEAKNPTWREDFLRALAETPIVTDAAMEAGVPRYIVYGEREKNPAFAEAWDKAKAWGLDALEDEAFARAMKGWEEVTYVGRKVTKRVNRVSDTLMIFLLKGNRPEKYRDQVGLGLTTDGSSLTINIGQPPPELEAPEDDETA